jgi:hypothetical protein
MEWTEQQLDPAPALREQAPAMADLQALLGDDVDDMSGAGGCAVHGMLCGRARLR